MDNAAGQRSGPCNLAKVGVAGSNPVVRSKPGMGEGYDARGLGRSLLVLPQHADQHRPERPILLAIDSVFRLPRAIAE